MGPTHPDIIKFFYMVFIPEKFTLAKGIVIYFARLKTKSISTDG